MGTRKQLTEIPEEYNDGVLRIFLSERDFDLSSKDGYLLKNSSDLSENEKIHVSFSKKVSYPLEILSKDFRAISEAFKALSLAGNLVVLDEIPSGFRLITVS